MDKKQALSVLTQVTRQIQANADVHDQIKQALEVLREDVTKDKK